MLYRIMLSALEDRPYFCIAISYNTLNGNLLFLYLLLLKFLLFRTKLLLELSHAFFCIDETLKTLLFLYFLLYITLIFCIARYRSFILKSRFCYTAYRLT